MWGVLREISVPCRGAEVPRKCSPCRAFILARGRDERSGLVCLGLFPFSASDLGDLGFWGAVCVPSKLFLGKGKSLSVMQEQRSV